MNKISDKKGFIGSDMDFEKLKKAAKETLKIMSSKLDENDTDTADDAAVTEPQEDISAQEQSSQDNMSGDTQRIDLKSVFERLRTKHPEQEDEPADAATPQMTVSTESIDDLTKTVDEIDKRTAQITVAADENQEKIAAAIIEMNNGISELRELAAKADDKQGVSVNSLMAKLNATDKKLNDLTNSFASVSKLNDSIFDLKNSQMNTKNSLGDLEAAFYNLKRKMSTGILIISIISAVIAVLEIINLLS